VNKPSADNHLIEMPLPCVRNADGADPLLDALRREHGEARPDIAPELTRAAAVTARRWEVVEAAA
jgi:hypothetical protein